VASAGWVESQTGIVLSARPGNVDAALLGARAEGLMGSGDIATVTFRAHCTGDPAIGFATTTARDAGNRTLTAPDFAIATAAAVPARTLLFAPFPNPAHLTTTVPFALARGGAVDLAIYSVDGRRVRSLAHGALAPGGYRFTWAGDDDSRRPVSPGVYFARLVTPDRTFTRTLVRLR